MATDRKTATTSRARLPVAVVGATGLVGQRLVLLLDDHPYFRLVAVAAGPAGAGRTYGDVVRWTLDEPLPAAAAALRLAPPGPPPGAAMVFSAVDAATARELEPLCVASGQFVVSNASAFRLEPTVPLVVPEVNPEHLEMLRTQDLGSGRIVCNPNCTTIGLALALAPLHRAFGVEAAHVVTMQALSGAGLKGPSALEMQDNLLPRIAGEEEKVGAELPRLLGPPEAPSPLLLSVQCNRVAVLDGHVASVSVALREAADSAALIEAWRSFRGVPQELRLPFAPPRPVVVLDDADAPQPRLHRMVEGGMAAVIGRVRRCPVLGHRFVTLSHNAVRGAAGGALLLAELCMARGLVGSAAAARGAG